MDVALENRIPGDEQSGSNRQATGNVRLGRRKSRLFESEQGVGTLSVDKLPVVVMPFHSDRICDSGPWDSRECSSSKRSSLRSKRILEFASSGGAIGGAVHHQ